MGAWYMRAAPEDTDSNPPMMRSNVDLPQPEAPMRQTNSPFWICRLTSLRACMGRPLRGKTLPTSVMSRMGAALRVAVRSDIVLRAPLEQAVVDGDQQTVGDEAGEPDDDHAGYHHVGAREHASIHDRRAQAFRYAGHLSHYDQEP